MSNLMKALEENAKWFQELIKDNKESLKHKYVKLSDVKEYMEGMIDSITNEDIRKRAELNYHPLMEGLKYDAFVKSAKWFKQQLKNRLK